MDTTRVLPDRYNLRNVRRLIRNPILLRKELFLLGISANRRFERISDSLFGSKQEFDVMAADWDNLLILDGCRYDLFERRADLEGNLRRVRSKGSESWEFMEGNFAGRSLHDTVYVTANPHVYHLEENTFHAVDNLLDTQWNSDLRTVHPEKVADRALQAHEQYPNKRLIIHFMQPHFPFLGPTGSVFDHSGLEMHLANDEQTGAPNPWFGLLTDDELEVETVVKAYRENFDIVLPHVKSLLSELGGKTVVTSDHGNLVGERAFPIPVKLYGHPPGLGHDALREVPWLEVESSTRRSVDAEPPNENDTETDDDVVEDRLRALGYA